MCRISKETVMRANAKTKSRPLSDMRMSAVGRDGLVVSARHYGVSYTHRRSMSELKTSYSRSLKEIVK